MSRIKIFFSLKAKVNQIILVINNVAKKKLNKLIMIFIKNMSHILILTASVVLATIYQIKVSDSNYFHQLTLIIVFFFREKL